MKAIKLHIEMISIGDSQITCEVSDATEIMRLDYDMEEGRLQVERENHLSTLLYRHQHQFEKVMRSALRGKIKLGQQISCVFIDGFNFINNNDFIKYIRVDHRNGELDITVSEDGLEASHQIYADGSFSRESQKSAYGGFTEDPQGGQEIFFRSFSGGSSNLIELKAIIEGLQRLQDQESFQVFTDSRFVIRGLVQWVHFWKHNDWQTAYGSEVKYREAWQQAYALCQGHCIEFKWIKGHSGDLKQDFCHQLAKELTGNGGDAD